MSAQSFEDLGVSRAVLTTLSEQGFTHPFAIQSEVIADVLAGRDLLAKSPTGSGKTLAFGIPLVDRIQADDPRPSALVLAPTRELATQIVDDIREIAHSRALRVTAVYGGAGLVKQAQNAARSHILVATPGRLEDLLARGAFSLDRIKILVLDEADRMLDMGFRPVVDRIVALCPHRRQTLFFSATLDGDAGRIAREYTSDPAVVEVGPTDRRANIDVEHHFVRVSHEHRIESLVHELQADRDLTLVFVRTKRGADRLVKRLDALGVDSVAMHGNKSQRQREQALARFQAGDVDTLVATDVAARGIDVNGISHVINFDPPHDSETYVHRIGRTGRAGAKGVGITLVAPSEDREVSLIANTLGLDHGLTAVPHLARRAPRTGSGSHQAGPRGPKSAPRPQQTGSRPAASSGRTRNRSRRGPR